MIKRILVAVDGSESSHRALSMAGEIAQKYDAELVLIYVIRDTQIPDGVRKMADVELFHETRLTAMQMVGQQILDECETLVRSLGAEKIKSEVRPGRSCGSHSALCGPGRY